MGPQRAARPWERDLWQEDVVEPAVVEAQAAGEAYERAKGLCIAGVVVLLALAAVGGFVAYKRGEEAKAAEAAGAESGPEAVFADDGPGGHL